MFCMITSPRNENKNRRGFSNLSTLSEATTMDCPQESHTWTIRDKPTVKRLNKATVGDAIDSSIFTMFKDFKLYLRFRPNGLSKGKYWGNTFLILYITGLPPNRSAIHFRYELSLLETKTTCTKSTTFKQEFLNISWDKGILLTRSIKHLKQFTLTVTIQLLAVYDHKNNNVTNLYTFDDEYDEINFEQQHNNKRSKNEKKNNKKQKVIRSLSRSSILRKRSSIASLTSSKSFKTKKRESKSRSNLNITNAFDKLDSLENNIKKINTILNDLSDRVCNMERKYREHKQYDMFDINKEQYAVLMKEINGIKRAVDHVQKPVYPKIDIKFKKYNKHMHKSLISLQNLKQWLTNNVKLPEYFDVFVEHDIVDLSVLYKLSAQDLREMGIYKIGHQLKIIEQIENLHTNDGGVMKCEMDEHIIVTNDNYSNIDDTGSINTSNSDDLYAYATLGKHKYKHKQNNYNNHNHNGYPKHHMYQQEYEGDINLDTDTV